MTDDTKTLAVAGLALGGAYLLTREDGSSGTGTSGDGGGANQGGTASGGLSEDSGGDTVHEPYSDDLTLSGTIDSLDEFSAEEHGDLFGVTGTIDQDLSGDEDLSGTGLTEYEGELLDTDGGD